MTTETTGMEYNPEAPTYADADRLGALQYTVLIAPENVTPHWRCRAQVGDGLCGGKGLMHVKRLNYRHGLRADGVHTPVVDEVNVCHKHAGDVCGEPGLIEVYVLNPGA